MRWYAALIVFLFHVYGFTLWRPLEIFRFGQTGVTFFFVLSGFVLAWSTSPDLPARTFYRRRFARIYPSYLVMLVAGGAVVALWPAVEIPRSSVDAVAALLAVQSWVPEHSATLATAFNPPAWSLSVEALFYASFPFLARGLRRLSPRHRGELAAVGLVGAFVISDILAQHGWPTFALVNPLIRCAEFVFGMVLAMALQAGWRPRLPLGAALGLLGAACFVAWLTVSVAAWEARLPLPIEDYVVVLPAGLVLVSAAIADLDGRPGLLTRRWSVYLGEVSFAFYLVHYLVLAALVQGLGWRATGFADVAPVAVIFAAALGGAVLLHHLVELPCQRLLRGSRKSLGSGLGQQQPAIHGARRS